MPNNNLCMSFSSLLNCLTTYCFFTSLFHIGRRRMKVIIDTQKEGSYTVDELNEVRDMFARFLANFCIA